MSCRAGFATLLLAAACVSPDPATPATALPPEAGVPARILVSPSSSTLLVGRTADLQAIVENVDGATLNTPVVWSSDAPRVATVVGGTVVAIAPGTATVSASIGEMAGEATIRVVDSAELSMSARRASHP